jgi:hypothetical protein
MRIIAELKNQTLYLLELMSDSISFLSRCSLTYVCAAVPDSFSECRSGETSNKANGIADILHECIDSLVVLL